MKAPITLGIFAAIAMLGAGCTSYMAESPYKSSAIVPSERTVGKQPYRVESINVAMLSDMTKMYDELEKQHSKSLNSKLNGWMNGVDYAENARNAKEAYLDAIRTAKEFASSAFNLDVQDVSVPMVAFWRTFPHVLPETGLAEMGLPEYNPLDGEEEPSDDEILAAAASAPLLSNIVGQDILNADRLNDRLSEKYPGLFDANGKPIRIVIAAVTSPVVSSSRMGYAMRNDDHIDFAIWVWSATTPFRKKEPFPLPSSEFHAATHKMISTLGPASVGDAENGNEFVRGTNEQTQKFLIDGICAAIVEALNKLPEKSFNGIH